jgi:hypothetical protein
MCCCVLLLPIAPTPRLVLPFTAAVNHARRASHWRSCCSSAVGLRQQETCSSMWWQHWGSWLVTNRQQHRHSCSPKVRGSRYPGPWCVIVLRTIVCSQCVDPGSWHECPRQLVCLQYGPLMPAGIGMPAGACLLTASWYCSSSREPPAPQLATQLASLLACLLAYLMHAILDLFLHLPCSAGVSASFGGQQQACKAAGGTL